MDARGSERPRGSQSDSRRSVRSFLDASDPPWLQPTRKLGIAFILVGAALIVLWQGAFLANGGYRDNAYDLGIGFDRASGFQARFAPRFFYFLYYTGKFPISITQPVASLQYDRESAENLLVDNPHLVMEEHVFIRTGDLAKILLLFGDAWVNGTPQGATVKTFSAVFWIGSLLALFVSLSLLNHRLLAITLVVLIGSNPFQLGQIYATNNVLGYSIPTAVLMLALTAPIILARQSNRLIYLLPFLCGAALASVREIRTEPVLIILSVAAAYLLAKCPWQRKLILLASLAAAYAGTAALWSHHWDRKFDQAHSIVAQAGGVTFDGIKNLHHAAWHPFWCGLGDFDTKYGYRWWDGDAHAYAIPILNERLGTTYAKSKAGGWLLENYYTDKKNHQIILETLPEYSAVLREKVLGDIWNDPGWYLSILSKRAERIFTLITPIRIGFGTHYIDVPFSAWLLIPVLFVVLALRATEQVVLLLFFVPTSLTAFVVYSGGGFTYNSAFHLMLFALIFCWIVNALARISRPRQARAF